MPTLDQIDRFFAFADRQINHLVDAHPDRFPVYTRRGRWDFTGEVWTSGCEGFLGGQMWLLYLHTGDRAWRAKAERYSLLLTPRKKDRSVHDLGFLFWPTWKRWYDITGDPQINAAVVEAGQTLAQRYNPAGGYLHSFLGENSLLIDLIMNVGIVFYAAAELASSKLYNIALQHCLTTRRVLVRGDGSTANEGIFDPQTGEFLRQSAQQGWRADSCWARGLAWAIYGFTTVFEQTSDLRFLQTAEQCAQYYTARAPESGVPPNDLDEPEPAQPYESSAAAIAAGGLLHLARLVADDDQAITYRVAAGKILDTLLTPEFLANTSPGWEGLLKHGIYHQRKGLGVDESVMWGDYYLTEALYQFAHGDEIILEDEFPDE